MKFAIIDIGSNTAKAEIYRYKHGRLSAVAKYVERDMIADHKDGGVLDAEGISVLINIMSGFTALCAENGVDRIFPYATQSLRGISNAGQVCRSIKEATGLDVTIISGEQEARLGCEAFLYENDPDDAILSDMGGGSTEINVIRGGSVVTSVSLPFGSRSLCHGLGIGIFPTPAQILEIKNAVMTCAGRYRQDNECELYASGGTSAGLFRLYRTVTKETERSVTTRALSGLLSELGADPVRAEQLARKYTPDRYDTVYAGMYAHLFLCEALGSSVINHCKTTCRMGYARRLIKDGILK